MLYGGVEVTGSQIDGRIELTGLDYQRERGFQPSLLWRRRVAAGECWETVDRGRHADTRREMVLAEDPGEPHNYGTYCITPLFDEQLLTDFVLQPDNARGHAGRFYRVGLGGFLFMFFVPGARLSEIGEEFFIQENGGWLVPMQDGWSIGFLREDAKRVFGK